MKCNSWISFTALYFSALRQADMAVLKMLPRKCRYGTPQPYRSRTTANHIAFTDMRVITHEQTQAGNILQRWAARPFNIDSNGAVLKFHNVIYLGAVLIAYTQDSRLAGCRKMQIMGNALLSGSRAPSFGEEIANSVSHGVGLAAALAAAPFLLQAAAGG